MNFKYLKNAIKRKVIAVLHIFAKNQIILLDLTADNRKLWIELNFVFISVIRAFGFCNINYNNVDTSLKRLGMYNI